MKIHNISIINNNLSKYQEQKKNNQQSYNEIKHIKYTNIPVYKDYNISFPEEHLKIFTLRNLIVTICRIQ